MNKAHPFFLVFLLPAISSASSFSGKVVAVTDGDSITVQRGAKRVRVLLHGVDCPEKNQPFGKKARLFTSKRVIGKVVQVAVLGRARRGELVGRVQFVETDRDQLAGWRHPSCLNDSLVSSGLGWWDQKNLPNDRRYEGLEASAKKAKKGLWADRNAVAPWDWKRGIRVSPAVAAARAKMKVRAKRRVVRGDVKAKVFHHRGCEHYRCKNCTAKFKTSDLAVRAGFVPHDGCGSSKPQVGAGRSCTSDSDCVLDYSVRRSNPKDPCSCLRCGRVLPRPINKTTAGSLGRKARPKQCPAHRCPKCRVKPIPHNLRASCQAGQCVLRK